MTLPNRFKIIWWLLLLVGAGALLRERLSAIANGMATPPDMVVLLLFVALALAPIFKEIDLFGLKLKQNIRELKEEVANLRFDVRNSVDVRTQISPIFHASAAAPPPDSQLPALETRLRSVMMEVLREHGIDPPKFAAEIPSVTDDVNFLFRARYHIEKELRRILTSRTQADASRRPLPVFQIVRLLADEGLLDHRLAHVVREVFAVASPAVHGELVSDAKVAFVRDVAPELISALREVGSAPGVE
jgi:hypothetical protein